MKIKSGFILRENMVGNDNKVGVVICVDSSVSNLKNGYAQLNETGIFIWKMLEKGATKEEIVTAILKEYEGAPVELVTKDVDNIITAIKNLGAIDE
jgi:hypothetical protein